MCALSIKSPTKGANSCRLFCFAINVVILLLNVFTVRLGLNFFLNFSTALASLTLLLYSHLFHVSLALEPNVPSKLQMSFLLTSANVEK
jgi:hypothetical protein